MKTHLPTFTRRGGRRNTDNTAYRSKRGAAADETGARNRRARAPRDAPPLMSPRVARIRQKDGQLSPSPRRRKNRERSGNNAQDRTGTPIVGTHDALARVV